MNLPGFTAEASIYKASERYQLTIGSGDNTDWQAVTMAMRVWCHMEGDAVVCYVVR